MSCRSRARSGSSNPTSDRAGARGPWSLCFRPASATTDVPRSGCTRTRPRFRPSCSTRTSSGTPSRHTFSRPAGISPTFRTCSATRESAQLRSTRRSPTNAVRRCMRRRFVPRPLLQITGVDASSQKRQLSQWQRRGCTRRRREVVHLTQRGREIPRRVTPISGGSTICS